MVCALRSVGVHLGAGGEGASPKTLPFQKSKNAFFFSIMCSGRLGLSVGCEWCRLLGKGCRVKGVGCRLRVSGVGCRVKGAGHRGSRKMRALLAPGVHPGGGKGKVPPRKQSPFQQGGNAFLFSRNMW